MEPVHLPVMADEVLQYLAADPSRHQVLLDCTLGEGGHSERFLKSFPLLSVCGIDADASIQERARERLAPFGDRVEFYNSWFDEFFASYPLPEDADLILFDLGISIFHYQLSGRGFSFAKEETLSMRLDSDDSESVSEFLATCSEKDLADVLFRFGEERYSFRIAKAIVAFRKERGVAAVRTLSSKALAELIWSAVPADYRHGRLHPATKSFQALRIRANDELGRLERALSGAFGHLKSGGRMAVISFHSLEDRIVKTYFRELSRDCVCPPENPVCTCGGKAKARLLTRKPVVAGPEENRINAPSRSAKLRAIVKN